MQFLTEIMVGILTVYITFTNSIAALLLPPETDIQPDTLTPITEESNEDGFFTNLPGRIGSSIPDILLRSAEYQSAALASATEIPVANTTDPIEALVNIFCTFTTPEYIRTTTGTGFFIDPDGVIMTNAHVAQFLLLEETEEFGSTECVVRAGNPASRQYYADLLYLPPAWVQDNASVLYDEIPMGTGERDYALLYVTNRVDARALPSQFPALQVDASLLATSIKNTDVIAAGYPAGGFLAGGPSADLIPVRAETSVSELYTFGSNYADVLSIRGSAVGAEGASGGPVLNDNGDVIGIIVTRGDDTIDGPGSLRAITISHVHRTMEEETGFGLRASLSGNLPYRSRVFTETISPYLLTILESGRPTD